MKEIHLDFINKLITKSLKPLPGIGAHQLIRPNGNAFNTMPYRNNSRESAVLLLLFPDHADELNILLIKRNEYSGIHSGQISFPGGSFENNDICYRTTALREAYEETGLEPSIVNIICCLTSLYIPPSNFNLHPYLGYCHETPQFIADPREVQYLIYLPLKEFLYNTEIVKNPILVNDQSFMAPGFEFNQHFIWGATAMILCELKELFLY